MSPIVFWEFTQPPPLRKTGWKVAWVRWIEFPTNLKSKSFERITNRSTVANGRTYSKKDQRYSICLDNIELISCLKIYVSPMNPNNSSFITVRKKNQILIFNNRKILKRKKRNQNVTREKWGWVIVWKSPNLLNNGCKTGEQEMSTYVSHIKQKQFPGFNLPKIPFCHFYPSFPFFEFLLIPTP